MTIKSLSNSLFQIENKYDLFNYSINEVFFWKLIRFDIIKIIQRATGLYGQDHTPAKENFTDKLKIALSDYKNSLFHSVCRRKKACDILVIEHGRKVKSGNSFIDIYTQPIVHSLQLSNSSYEIVDRKYNQKHYCRPNKQRSYLEYKTIGSVLKKRFNPFRLTHSEKEKLLVIENEIYKTFSVSINLIALVLKKITNFKNDFQAYKKMLVVRKVKQVYLVVSYVMEAMIAACKAVGVECIELQHGVMNAYHLGYSFPYNKTVPYFPDKLLLFGKYWYDTTPMPLEESQTEVIGYPYLIEKLKAVKDVACKDGVLFISQGTVGQRLTADAVAFAKAYPEIPVTVKLHPGEFERWEREYSELVKAEQEKVLTVMGKGSDMYKLLAQYEYVVGSNSTVLFEAIMLGCRIIIMNYPGIEYMETLLEKKCAIKADSIQDIKKVITDGKFDAIDTEYFFA